MGLLTLVALVQLPSRCLLLLLLLKMPPSLIYHQIHSSLYSWSYLFITRGKVTLTLETRPTFLKDSMNMGHAKGMALDQIWTRDLDSEPVLLWDFEGIALASNLSPLSVVGRGQ